MCDCGLPFEAAEAAAYFKAHLHPLPYCLSSSLPPSHPIPLLAHKCGLPLDSGNTIASVHSKLDCRRGVAEGLRREEVSGRLSTGVARQGASRRSNDIGNWDNFNEFI